MENIKELKQKIKALDKEEEKEPAWWLSIIKMVFCWYIWEAIFEFIKKSCCCCCKSDEGGDNSFLKSLFCTGAAIIPGIIYALVHIFKWLELMDTYDKLNEEIKA
ncbi:hypothetical protein C2G38_2149025 [Gigaspora rosea]|uniref:Uncharacterized protein n=1 Tax=Gigaspora rosea TaxID=44941 RepID=A0A397U5V5_9GLOM|nr:hypothetical protein C2G38_2149025 [Gigaspora rosea]